MVSAQFFETTSILVSVYDLAGQQLSRHQFGIQPNGGVLMLPVGELVHGFYFIRAVTNAGSLIFSGKFIKNSSVRATFDKIHCLQ